MEETRNEATILDHNVQFLQGEFDMKNNNDDGSGMSMNPEKNAVQLEREVEKRKIREEIIASEIIRRRELEAEVRMELMMEKQILGNSGDKIGGEMNLINCPSGGNDEFLQPNSRPLESDVIGSDDKRNVEEVALGKWPFERDPSHAAVHAAKKINAELADDQVMAEVISSSGIVGMKRKAEMSARACDDESTPAMSKDSHKWFCSLCEVSTTSEVTLDGHFRGKKHKAKEAKSKANVTTSSISLGSNTATDAPLPLQPDSSISSEQENSSSIKKWECSVCQLSVSSEILLNSHLQGKKHKAKEAKLQTGENLVDQKEFSSGKSLVLPIPSINENGTDTDKQWHCSLCGVSASSENNLNDHLQGKKHRAKAGLPQQEIGIVNHENTPKMLETEAVKDKSLDGGDSPRHEQKNSSPSIDQCKDESELELIDGSSKKLTFDAGDMESGLTDGNKQETNLVSSQETKDTDNHGDTSLDFVKYWQCKMCNKGTHDEATMAAHRKSNEHMALLMKHGGGLISVVSIPKGALDAGGNFREEASA